MARSPLCFLGAWSPPPNKSIRADSSSPHHFLSSHSLPFPPDLLPSSCLEEEVVIDGKCATWSAGGATRCVYETYETIIQAMWSRMQGSPSPVLLLLHSNSITSVTPSGGLDQVPLPWEAQGMFPIPGGVLLQRKGGGVGATLMALMEPQGDLLEVSLGKRGEEGDRLIWSSCDTPLAVTYHSGLQRHSLWRMEGGGRSFTCCWQQGGVAEEAAQVVVWEDSGGEPLVGLLTTSGPNPTLLCVSPTHPPWQLPAQAAAVITPPATRSCWSKVVPRKHLLVMAPTSTLTLYSGRHPVWSGSAPDGCVGLRDAVGDRVTILRQDGQMDRCRVRCASITPLVTSCLASVHATCPPPVHARLAADLATCPPQEEWERLTAHLVGWAGEVHPPSQPRGGVEAGKPLNSWERLLASKRGLPQGHPSGQEGGGDREGLRTVLLSLLSVSQDLHMDCLRIEEARSVALLIATLAGALGEVDILDAMHRQFPSALPPLGPIPVSPNPLPAPPLLRPAPWLQSASVSTLVSHNIGLPELERLPLSLSLPLYQTLQAGQPCCPPGLPPSSYLLVGREDLAAQCAVGAGGGADPLLSAAAHSLQLRAAPLLQSVRVTPPGLPGGGEGDGLEHLAHPHSPQRLRFGEDGRLGEACNLLASSRPVPLRLGGPDSVSVSHQQTLLWRHAQRTTALAVGRAALGWATRSPTLSEVVSIPRVVLAGCLPSQNNATVALDGSLGSIPDLTEWPDFHNGCAAGLALRAGEGGLTLSLIRTWIGLNRNAVSSKEAHAGLLLALGLQGQLSLLAPTDIYSYLAQEVGIEEVTTVGLLLGMAAAKRGSQDPALSKMLHLHIPSRHPSSFPDLDLPTLVQSAALLSLGLLYQGSGHRLSVEVVMHEIGRVHVGEDCESYSLAAGLALGMVTLGQGGGAFGLTDLNLENHLERLFSSSSSSSQGQGGRGGKEKGRVKDQVPPSVSETRWQGPGVNTSITAPGALMALALMYLKTNDASVADRISIPCTQYALDLIRPDFLLLRTLARGLILWDSVRPTEEWVRAQLPPLVQPGGGGEGTSAASASCHLVAGACMVIGLRFAGTGDPDAHKLLEKYTLGYLKEKRKAGCGLGAVDPTVVELCLGSVAVSMATVMAGSGHLPTLRLLRMMMKRSDPEVCYGNHMAISLAVGLLFLGGGMATLSRSNEGVAALLIALYPRYPANPKDNRCHLQALRHLWVLAARVRSCAAVDVDTGVPLLVPTRIRVGNSPGPAPTPVTRFTPCLLPDHPSIEVEVVGPRYWPQRVQHPMAGVVVKRRVGACSYLEDPLGLRSNLVGPSGGNKGGAISVDTPVLMAFSRHLADTTKGNYRAGALSTFCSSLLAAARSADHPGVLHLHWATYAAGKAIKDGGRLGGGSTDRLGLPATHLLAVKALVHLPSSPLPLFPSHLVALLEEAVGGWVEGDEGAAGMDEYIRSCRVDQRGWMRSPMEGVEEARGGWGGWRLACMLLWKEFPCPTALSRGMTSLGGGREGLVPLPLIAAAMPGATEASITWLAKQTV